MRSRRLAAFAATLLFLLPPGVVAAPNACPSNWKVLGGTCVAARHSEKPLSWFEAEMRCREEGAHLVMPDLEIKEVPATWGVQFPVWVGLRSFPGKGWLGRTGLTSKFYAEGGVLPDATLEDECVALNRSEHDSATLSAVSSSCSGREIWSFLCEVDHGCYLEGAEHSFRGVDPKGGKQHVTILPSGLVRVAERDIGIGSWVTHKKFVVPDAWGVCDWMAVFDVDDVPNVFVSSGCPGKTDRQQSEKPCPSAFQAPGCASDDGVAGQTATGEGMGTSIGLPRQPPKTDGGRQPATDPEVGDGEGKRGDVKSSISWMLWVAGFAIVALVAAVAAVGATARGRRRRPRRKHGGDSSSGTTATTDSSGGAKLARPPHPPPPPPGPLPDQEDEEDEGDEECEGPCTVCDRFDSTLAQDRLVEAHKLLAADFADTLTVTSATGMHKGEHHYHTFTVSNSLAPHSLRALADVYSRRAKPRLRNTKVHIVLDGGRRHAYEMEEDECSSEDGDTKDLEWAAPYIGGWSG